MPPWTPASAATPLRMYLYPALTSVWLPCPWQAALFFMDRRASQFLCALPGCLPLKTFRIPPSWQPRFPRVLRRPGNLMKVGSTMVSLGRGEGAHGNMVVQNAMGPVHQPPGTGFFPEIPDRPGCRNPGRFGHSREAPYKPVRKGRHGHLFVTGLGGCPYNLNPEHHCPVKGGAPLVRFAIWMPWLFAKKVVPGDPPWLPMGFLDVAYLADFPNAVAQTCENEPVPPVVATAAHGGPYSCMPDPPLYGIAIVPRLTFLVFAVLCNSWGDFPSIISSPTGLALPRRVPRNGHWSTSSQVAEMERTQVPGLPRDRGRPPRRGRTIPTVPGCEDGEPGGGQVPCGQRVRRGSLRQAWNERTSPLGGKRQCRPRQVPRGAWRKCEPQGCARAHGASPGDPPRRADRRPLPCGKRNARDNLDRAPIQWAAYGKKWTLHRYLAGLGADERQGRAYPATDCRREPHGAL